MIDKKGIDLVLNSGSTEISPRDIIPEATGKALDKESPGFGEIVKKESSKIAPFYFAERVT